MLTTSLVTTHLPLAKVSRTLGAAAISRAIVELGDLLLRSGVARPRLAVCAFNPHAGEGELLGSEERRAIVPGIERARRVFAKQSPAVSVRGPIGAETAFRLGAAGRFDGLVSLRASHDWDIAAAQLLVAEAGGRLTDAAGRAIVLNQDPPRHAGLAAAGSKELHDALLQRLGSAASGV